MSRRLAGLCCMLTITCSGLAGCATTFLGDKSSPFRKGEQKEPVVADDDDEKEPSDWKKEATRMRGESKKKPGRDRWVDNLIWSSESQDIARSLNADL